MNILERPISVREDYQLLSSLPVISNYPTRLDQWLDGVFADYLLEPLRYQAPEEVWREILLDPVRQFLSRPGKGLRQDFVQLGWQIAWLESHPDQSPQSCPECPAPLIAIIELLHAGSLIVDDIEDDSEMRRGYPCLHKTVGLAPALNMGNWLYFVSGSLIESLECGQLIKGQLHRTLNRIMLRCHQGQSLDVSIKITQVAREDVSALVDTSTRLKSGVLIGFALQLGSIFLGQSRVFSERLYHFGEQLGLALQMYDDLSGILKESRWSKGDEDLLHGRLTWVWAWLANDSELSRDDYETLIELVRRLNQPPPASDRQSALFKSWRQRCEIHIAHRSEEIETVIDHACHGLIYALENPALSQVILKSIERLKRSYL